MGRLLEVSSWHEVERTRGKLDVNVSAQQSCTKDGSAIEKGEVTGVHQQEEVCLEIGLRIDVVDWTEGLRVGAVSVKGQELEGNDVRTVQRLPIGARPIILSQGLPAHRQREKKDEQRRSASSE